MDFLRANIDRAIVMTQFDLRGFADPLGFRHEYMLSAKNLAATTQNLVAFAAGLKNVDDPNSGYVNSEKGSFEEYLAMCQQLAKQCDLSQKEAIQLIVQEIVKQSEEMKAQVAAGTRDKSGYLYPLDKGNYWGKIVLALGEAFEIELEQLVA
jgi:hypothetical protein